MDDLPQPRLRTLWRLRGLLIALAITSSTFVTALAVLGSGLGQPLRAALPWSAIIAALMAVLAIALLDGHARAAFRRYGWQHKPGEGVVVRRGAWWWREIWIPLQRLQHLDVVRGPLERRLGLATLVLFTAGSHDHRTSLPGLDPVRANALRDALLAEMQLCASPDRGGHT